MAPRIVALIDHDDEDYRGVLEALRGSGHEVVAIELGRSDDATDLRFTFDGFRIEQAGGVLTDSLVADAAVVIYRRWRMADTPVVESTLTDADARRFAELEWNATFTAILRNAEASAGRASWINAFSVDWLSRDKLSLLRCAREVGLIVPPLIVATHAEAPAERVVAKAINVDETIDGARAYPTTTLSSKLLADYVGHRSSCPSLLQQRIDADYELRAFVIRDEVAAVRVASAAPHDDIRYADPSHLTMDRAAVSLDLKSQLVALTARLGLSYCAFDLLHNGSDVYLVDITPNGRWGPYEVESSYLTDWVASTISALARD
jgi:hypothetical protein